jgi:hypothetical protein
VDGAAIVEVVSPLAGIDARVTVAVRHGVTPGAGAAGVAGAAVLTGSAFYTSTRAPGCSALAVVAAHTPVPAATFTRRPSWKLSVPVAAS